MRTTLDIEKPLLDELKAFKAKEKRSLSKIASQLLAEALATRRNNANASRNDGPGWTTSAMDARVDLSDKEAVYRAMDKR